MSAKVKLVMDSLVGFSRLDVLELREREKAASDLSARPKCHGTVFNEFPLIKLPV